jgi:hypothetical protein
MKVLGFSDADCRSQPHCYQRRMRFGSSCADLAVVAAASSTPFEDWSFVCDATDCDRWIDPANLRLSTGDVDRLSLHCQSKPDDSDGRSDAADRLSAQVQISSHQIPW